MKYIIFLVGAFHDEVLADGSCDGNPTLNHWDEKFSGSSFQEALEKMMCAYEIDSLDDIYINTDMEEGEITFSKYTNINNSLIFSKEVEAMLADKNFKNVWLTDYFWKIQIVSSMASQVLEQQMKAIKEAKNV